MTRPPKDDDSDYGASLRRAQIQLVKFQKHVIKRGQKIVLIFEGRDAAGKDGAIKRIVEHLSPRDTRVVALSAPSDRDRNAWYFQRNIEHLPVAGEIVLFNRSWYNRAGVERVMGFASDEEVEQFLNTVPMFEHLLVHCGFTIIKYYLDISRDEEERRLKKRRKDPLRQWKLSPIDAKAIEYWDEYSKARDAMFPRTHAAHAPWIIVKADDKKSTRLNIIRDILSRCEFHGKDKHGELPDSREIFQFDESHLKDGIIAH